MNSRDPFSKYAEYLSLGLEIAAALTIPIFAGYGLDVWLDTSPWFILAGCLVGMVNIFVLIFRMNSRLNNEQ